MTPRCRTATVDDRTCRGEELSAWLIGPGRLSGDAVVLTSGFAEQLIGMGIPLHRLRTAMRVDNPLLTAWGIIWAPETAAELFTISQALRDSPTYLGSPSQHVMETGTFVRWRLDRLERDDHTVLHELASAGFTDYLAVPVAFGNGIIQPAMFATRHDSGFDEGHIALIKSLSVPLSAALEAIAMRRSTASLLATFLGEGPAARVQAARSTAATLSRRKQPSCSQTCAGSRPSRSQYPHHSSWPHWDAISRPWPMRSGRRGATF